MPKRKIRSHGQLPAGWTWRDGRPRWKASPTLRKAGWRDRDLKDGAGQWLTEGPSIDAARAIVAGVTAWREGEPVPAALAAIAPQGATAKGRGPKGSPDPRSIGTLLDAYLASREFTRKIGERTRPEYRSKLKRLVDILSGYAFPPERDAPAADVSAYQEAIAETRALSVDVLMPPAFGEPGEPLLKTAYWLMRDKVGHHMANGVMAVASAWLEWCVTERRAIHVNPARLVSREETEGRIRPGTVEELQALIAAAQALGWVSIADSIILGVDLSWNQNDRLNLTWSMISAEGRCKKSRRKTGRMMETPLLETLGKPRLAAIRARQVEATRRRLGVGADTAILPNQLPTHVLLCEGTGALWEPSYYRRRFREVRALAVAGDPARGLEPCPSVADLTDQDLRDTAVTFAYEAGLDEQEIASRTGHSLKRIRDILDKHYGEITRAVGDRGAKKLNDWMAGQGISL